MRLLTLLGYLLLTVALEASVAAPTAKPAAGKPGEPSLADLLRDMKDPSDGARQRKAAEQLHERFKKAFGRAANYLTGQVSREHQAYLAAFYARGRTAARAKVGEGDVGQMKAWQTTLVECAVEKEPLKKDAGPALQSLREVLTVSVREVLDGNADLAKRRQALLGQADLRNWCGKQLHPDDTEQDPPAKASDDNTKPKPEPFSVTLEREEQLLAMMCLNASDADRRVLEANWKARNDARPTESLGIADVNVMRILKGKRALRLDAKLCNAARSHSADMTREKFFSHTSPVSGKKTPWDRAKKAGTSASGECIYKGSQSPLKANMAWFFSPGHHKIMLAGSPRRLGMGVDGGIWTLMTGK